MNVRFDLDNPIMRVILGIAEYFLDTAAIRLDHERSSFLHQSLVKLMLKIKEEILGRRASLGLQFLPLSPSCALDLLWLKRNIRDSSQSGIKSKFNFLVDFSSRGQVQLKKATNHVKIVFRMGWDNIKIYICSVSALAGPTVKKYYTA